MANRGRLLSAESALVIAARYNTGCASRTPAAFMLAFLMKVSSWLSAITWRQAAICSWMLILTGHTFEQLPFKEDENGSALYLCRLKLGSMIRPIGPEYVAP